MNNELMIDKIAQDFITQCATLVAQRNNEDGGDPDMVDVAQLFLVMTKVIKNVSITMNYMGGTVTTEDGAELSFKNALIAALEGETLININDGV